MDPPSSTHWHTDWIVIISKARHTQRIAHHMGQSRRLTRRSSADFVLLHSTWSTDALEHAIFPRNSISHQIPHSGSYFWFPTDGLWHHPEGMQWFAFSTITVTLVDPLFVHPQSWLRQERTTFDVAAESDNHKVSLFKTRVLYSGINSCKAKWEGMGPCPGLVRVPEWAKKRPMVY